MKIGFGSRTVVDDNTRLAPSSTHSFKDLLNSCRISEVTFERHGSLAIFLFVLQRPRHGCDSIAFVAETTGYMAAEARARAQDQSDAIAHVAEGVCERIPGVG